MRNGYDSFFNGFNKAIFDSAKLITKSSVPITRIISKMDQSKMRIPTSRRYFIRKNSDQKSIENDYKKIGADLFKSLNKYEKSKQYETTSR